MEDFKKKNDQQKNMSNKSQHNSFQQKPMAPQGEEQKNSMNSGIQNSSKKEESRYFPQQKNMQSSAKKTSPTINNAHKSEKCDSNDNKCRSTNNNCK